MKEAIKKIAHYQTQMVVLDVLRSNVEEKLSYVIEGEDIEAIKEVLADPDNISDDYVFTEEDQKDAIKNIIGKELTLEEFLENIEDGIEGLFDE